MKAFITLLLGFVFLLPPFGSPILADDETPIQNFKDYFPDDVGMTWTYQGTVEDNVMRVTTYTNISTVTGTTKKNGVTVKIFNESNQANQGPSESYFSIKKDGIVYHGGEPTTPFEGHLIPYPVIQFDMTLHRPFSQLLKWRVPFGRDFDHDGREEIADVYAEITADGFETVSVPAGVFQDALKLKGKMVIRLTLSGSGEFAHIIDRTTTWLALNIGTVKATESIEFPQMDGSAPLGTVIEEVLSAFSEQSHKTQ